MKKSYILFITIVLITLFSYLSVFNYETKSLSSSNIKNQYLHLQAKNHLQFMEELIKQKDLDNINHLKIEDKTFDIEAKIKKENSKQIIDIFIKAKKYDVRVYKRVVK